MLKGGYRGKDSRKQEEREGGGENVIHSKPFLLQEVLAHIKQYINIPWSWAGVSGCSSSHVYCGKVHCWCWCRQERGREGGRVGK